MVLTSPQDKLSCTLLSYSGIGVAVVLSFLYVVLIGFLAGPVVCVGVILSILLVTASELVTVSTHTLTHTLTHAHTHTHALTHTHIHSHIHIQLGCLVSTSSIASKTLLVSLASSTPQWMLSTLT